MNDTLRNPWRLPAALALGLALSGCVIAPLGPGPGSWGDDDGPVVEVAPPPLRYETRPMAPGPGYVWIGGYWSWQLGRHAWVGGRWAMPPAGRVWMPGQWQRQDRGWRWRRGYWGRH